MSYCRFENTYNDLRDCLENIEDELEEGGHEERARVQLIKTCFAIVRPFLIAEDENGYSRTDTKLDLDALNQLPIERD